MRSAQINRVGTPRAGHRRAVYRLRSVAPLTIITATAMAGCIILSAAWATNAGALRPQIVKITLTPKNCAPIPATVKAGLVQFNVKNKNASQETEAELQSGDHTHLLGEQENLTPGLSGGFSLTIPAGHYIISCPGATTSDTKFTVTGKAKASSASGNPLLTKAVASYATYINGNVVQLISSSQRMCNAINAGNLTQAQQLYAQARVFYERIEPVAEVWGTLDTAIDGRINNPVTNPADLEGFHRLEMIMWTDDTLTGAASYCNAMVQNQQQLQQLVSRAQYSPLTIVGGATDLINEAATSKITGEEERYSNTDLVVFQANVDGAMEVVNLMKPYLQTTDPALVSQIQARFNAVESAIAKYKATPGYDDTGYVDYRMVPNAARRALSGTVQAFAESLSKMSGQVA